MDYYAGFELKLIDILPKENMKTNKQRLLLYLFGRTKCMGYVKVSHGFDFPLEVG